MLGACTGDSASADLAAIGDVFAKGGDIFVIDIAHLVATEAARLLLELLIKRSCFCAFILWLAKSLVISCSHYGAPFRALLFNSYELREGMVDLFFKRVVRRL